MAIALRGNSYSATSTCNKPSGVVSGDLMLAWIYCDGNGSSNTGPSGWTLLERISSTGGYTQELWYKLAGGSEPSSYTWTYSGSGAGDNVSMDAFSGNTLSVDKHASAYSTTAGTTIEAPAITPTASGECCVTFAIMYSGTGTQPTGYTQACDALSVSDGIPSAYETGQGIGAVQPNWGTGSANWGCATLLIAEGAGGTTHTLGTPTRESYRIRAQLTAQSRATDRIRALLTARARDTWRTRSGLTAPTRQTYVIRKALVAPSRERFIIRMALRANARETWKTRIAALGNQPRATWRTRIAALGVATRDTFRVRLGLLTAPSRERFLSRAALAVPSRATWKTRIAGLAAATRDTFKVRAVLGDTARDAFKVRAVLSAPSRDTFKVRIAALSVAARDSFRLRMALLAAARDTFKVGLGGSFKQLATWAHESYVIRRALISPSRATDRIRFTSGQQVRATFKTRIAALATRTRAAWRMCIAALGTAARDTWRTRAWLVGETRASFRMRHLAAMQVRATASVRAGLALGSRATFTILLPLHVLGTAIRTRAVTRMALSTPARDSFRLRLSIAQQAMRATFRVLARGLGWRGPSASATTTASDGGSITTTQNDQATIGETTLE